MTTPLPAPAADIDELDLRLLIQLDRTPNASLAVLAENLGVGERTVGRRYARLREDNLVRIVGRTPPGVDGRLASLIRVTTSPDSAETLGRRLARHDDVTWARLSRDGAELNLVTTSNEVQQLLQRNPHVRAVRSHDLLTGWGRDGRAADPAREVDDLDRIIVQELSHDGRAEIKAIAERAGVNSSTVSRRRAKLIDDDLLHFSAEIAPEALAGTGAALLWLTVPPGRIRQTGEVLHNLPECRFVAACSGEASLVAEVLVESPEALVDFVDARLAGLDVVHCEIVTLGARLTDGGAGP
ncbi:transcriptional regulator [Corynebacterium maris DSM 45190]|uniref:Transcriptional regulator n=1 Tax=Corynebacterium maris DSM 45190 TaxID=1224163 RepID=S5TFV9_9CORY|nr:AsnC family transcriptional regulator [Corynebacterium maris]AGS33538.1 transcriptional regulator [Corynebacterium maris DSM 45190]